MQATLPYHLTSGDSAASILRAAGLPGTIHVWHDVLYEGTHEPGWPCAETLCLRARMLENHTGGGDSFTLWQTINDLSLRRPPLVRIEGPTPRLPQWPGQGDIDAYVIKRAR